MLAKDTALSIEQRLEKTGLRGFRPGLEVTIHFSCSAKLRLKSILLINVKMPTTVGSLKFISKISYKTLYSKPVFQFTYLGYFVIYEQFKFYKVWIQAAYSICESSF